MGFDVARKISQTTGFEFWACLGLRLAIRGRAVIMIINDEDERIAWAFLGETFVDGQSR
jgi:hypothetical protein